MFPRHDSLVWLLFMLGGPCSSSVLQEDWWSGQEPASARISMIPCKRPTSKICLEWLVTSRDWIRFLNMNLRPCSSWLISSAMAWNMMGRRSFHAICIIGEVVGSHWWCRTSVACIVSQGSCVNAENANDWCTVAGRNVVNNASLQHQSNLESRVTI